MVKADAWHCNVLDQFPAPLQTGLLLQGTDRSDGREEGFQKDSLPASFLSAQCPWREKRLFHLSQPSPAECSQSWMTACKEPGSDYMQHFLPDLPSSLLLVQKIVTPLLVAVRLGEGFHCFASTNSSNNNMTRLWWWQRWKFLSLWAALHHLLLLLLHSEFVGRTKMAGRAACCEAKLLSEGGMCLWELPSLFGFWLEKAELEVNSLQSFPLFCLPFTFSSSHGPYKGCDLKWEAVCAINKQQLSLAGVWGHIQKEIAIDLGGTYIVFKCCVTARLDPAGDSAGDGFPLGPWGEHSAWWAAGFVYNGEDRNLSFILLLTFLPR